MTSREDLISSKQITCKRSQLHMKIPKHGMNLSNYHWKQKKIMATNVSTLKLDKAK